MKKILFTLLLLSQLYLAQSKNIYINIDGANFMQNDSLTRWELYYSFPDTSMAYVYKDSIFEAKFSFYIKIKSKDNIICEEKWFTPWQKMNSINSYQMDVIGKKGFELMPGKYFVELNAIDENDSNSKYSMAFNLNVKDFSSKKIEISDIEFANIIKLNNQFNSDSSSNIFILPNPSLTYISKKPTLLAYYEIYNFKKNLIDSLSINYSIFNSHQIKLSDTNCKIIPRSDKMFLTVELPFDTLQSGTYFFNYILRTYKNNIVDSLSDKKKFYIINLKKPSLKQSAYTEDHLFSISEWATLNENDIEAEFLKAKYIATN
jgi:hypothetical protein